LGHRQEVSTNFWQFNTRHRVVSSIILVAVSKDGKAPKLLGFWLLVGILHDQCENIISLELLRGSNNPKIRMLNCFRFDDLMLCWTWMNGLVNCFSQILLDLTELTSQLFQSNFDWPDWIGQWIRSVKLCWTWLNWLVNSFSQTLLNLTELTSELFQSNFVELDWID